ncbi:acyltransferase family protein [Actinoplanes xinjiangensis]|uniref:Peptidoglycan/LPS O-acetylase OafA/YrhL n=1 Tax=Actinoplanes xinjiangensis TaxID=512350 RepID=A0A316FSZ0_9ACTN|nr:acyltransferase [Actinoplanes xinjiangensis]PWK43412.1 peptidoglycan/LPS O-acetylase OafA/YrhL [Actinoplanes xinjiangensis]GIF41729.1 acyltransferase [Actinoplanes xinjiangensis]
MTAAVDDQVAITNTARPVPSRSVRLYALDALRLACALAVVGYHLGTSWRLDGVHPPGYFLPGAAPVLIYGFLGVEVFFLISGFVISMSGWGRTVREFAASRAARLYPAFWAGVLITAVVVTVLPVTDGVPVSGVPSLGDVAINLTMLAEPFRVPLVDTVYWTLWVELRFYLIIACLIAVGLMTGRGMRVLGTGWLITVVLAPALPSTLMETVVMPGFAPYFIAGMTMFLLRRDRRDRWSWVLLAGCWLVSLHHVELRVLDLRPGFAVPVWPATVLITLAYAVLLAVALGVTDRLAWRRLGAAGALTYPFYLLHQRIGYSLMRTVHDHTGWPAWLLLTGTVIVLLAASWLVYRLVERPLSPRMRRRLLGRGRAPGTPRHP